MNRILLLAIVALLSISGFCAEPNNSALVVLNNDNLYRPTKAPKCPTVLDFNATWCGPCRRLNPAIHAAAQEFKGKVEVVSIDIDSNPATARAFNVQSIPTVVFMMPDGSVESHVGLGDFMSNAPMNPNMTVEEGERILKDNLFKMIKAMLNTKPAKK